MRKAKVLLHVEHKHDFRAYESSDHYDRYPEDEMLQAMRNTYGVAL